ncbi:MAG: aminotransferase class V-fold PLP-dependent enzyme, partial [Bacteroidota bacterium]
MDCQKHLFNLPPNKIYLNCARRGPQSKQLAELGVAAVQRQCNPDSATNADFFGVVHDLKVAFSDLVEANDPDRIAIIPSVSYGLANVANNLNLKKGEKIIVVGEQFPSNVYPWLYEVEKAGAEIEFVKAPNSLQRGQNWNAAILAAIDDRTKMVALGNVHWADGTL